MGRIHVAGPNTAIVVSGTGGATKKKIVVGTWVYASPLLSDVQYLSLNLMKLEPKCHDVETAEGVPVNVNGIAHCKVINSPEFLLIAAEQFLGRTNYEIKSSILLTLEGHLRSILGSLTVEEVNKNREKFASLVREEAANDVAKMGIQIVSFLITEIDDNVGYLASIGKKRIAEVKRDADIGVAIAERDAGMREAECEKDADNVKFRTLANIENHSRKYFLQKTEFDKEVNSAKAEAALAYELQEARLNQEIRQEQIAIDIVERMKGIEIEQKEIERKERELIVNVKLPSEAESYRMQTIAEGEKFNVIQKAIGDGEKIKLVGLAEANKMRIIQTAGAEGRAKRAKSLKNFNNAAITHLILQKLPEIASHISAPLAKTEEIVILGENNE